MKPAEIIWAALYLACSYAEDNCFDLRDEQRGRCLLIAAGLSPESSNIQVSEWLKYRAKWMPESLTDGAIL